MRSAEFKVFARKPGQAKAPVSPTVAALGTANITGQKRERTDNVASVPEVDEDASPTAAEDSVSGMGDTLMQERVQQDEERPAKVARTQPV